MDRRFASNLMPFNQLDSPDLQLHLATDNRLHEPPSSTPEAGHAMFETWNLYERIVAGNWMRHRELTSAIATCLMQSQTDLRVLDIGSGDGWLAHQGLANTSILQYVALDASADALERLLARSAPGKHPSQCERAVQRGDFLTTIQDQPARHFDIVLCSYSLHHLRTEQKHRMLNHIDRVLKPQGRLVWIDAYLGPDETRDQYLTRLGKFITQDWSLLQQQERQETLQHIWSSDFPESEQTMRSLLAQSDFVSVKTIWCDDYFGMWEATKQAVAGSP